MAHVMSCIAYDECNAAIAGIVASDGSFSGDNIFYIYPDRRHAFVGLFDDGVMIKAKPVMLDSIFTHHCDRPPLYKLIDAENVKSTISQTMTASHVIHCCQITMSKQKLWLSSQTLRRLVRVFLQKLI